MLPMRPGVPLRRTTEYRRHGVANLDAALDVASGAVITTMTKAVRTWLLRHPRFVFHFTPTYSSWMNQVERWFAALTTKYLQRSVHRSVAELTRGI